MLGRRIAGALMGMTLAVTYLPIRHLFSHWWCDEERHNKWKMTLITLAKIVMSVFFLSALAYLTWPVFWPLFQAKFILGSAAIPSIPSTIGFMTFLFSASFSASCILMQAISGLYQGFYCAGRGPTGRFLTARQMLSGMVDVSDSCHDYTSFEFFRGIYRNRSAARPLLDKIEELSLSQPQNQLAKTAWRPGCLTEGEVEQYRQRIGEDDEQRQQLECYLESLPEPARCAITQEPLQNPIQIPREYAVVDRYDAETLKSEIARGRPFNPFTRVLLTPDMLTIPPAPQWTATQIAFTNMVRQAIAIQNIPSALGIVPSPAAVLEAKRPDNRISSQPQAAGFLRVLDARTRAAEEQRSNRDRRPS